MTREELYKVTDILNSEVLPCFMHGGEADEVVAMLEEAVEKSGLLEEGTPRKESVSEDVYDDLSHFKAGDTIYCIENTDYYAAIVEIDDSFKEGDDAFLAKRAIIREAKGWTIVGNDNVFCEGDSRYRFATDEEKELLNRYCDEERS